MCQRTAAAPDSPIHPHSDASPPGAVHFPRSIPVLDSLLCRLPWADCAPPPVLAPIGAWIPPTEPTKPFASLGSAGGRPVLDAAEAFSHNESLFHGTWIWGLGLSLALVALAYIWTRTSRS